MDEAAKGLLLRVVCVIVVCASTVQARGQKYIEGKLFYNDLREFGCFAWRQDTAGADGVRDRDSGANWLGAFDVKATLYELDTLAKRKIGETYVLPNGHYIFPHDETERGGELEFAVAFDLSYSTSRRDFNVTTDGAFKKVYRYWHPRAKRGNPYVANEDESTVLPNAYFGGRETTGATNRYHQAALLFASVVDATRVWHEGDRWIGGEGGYRDAGKADPVPFGDDGTVHVRYPSSGTGRGRGKSPTELLIADLEYVIRGQLPMHEYGHVMQQRAWTHGYGWGPGNSDRWGGSDWPGRAIEPLRAFKEAWAEFVVIATMEQNGTDHSENDKSLAFHEARSRVDGQSGVDGHRWVSNIKRALTDWYDVENDNNPMQPGDGDGFSASLYSIWLNMEQTWVTASADERERGLGFLDYVDYYINERKSAARVGQIDHERYRDLIGDLIYENGIGRGFRPSWPHGERGEPARQAIVDVDGRWRDRLLLEQSENLLSIAIPPLVSSGEVRVRIRAENSFQPGAIVWDISAATVDPPTAGELMADPQSWFESSAWAGVLADADVLGFVREDAGQEEFKFSARSGVPYQVDVHRTARLNEPFEFHVAIFTPEPQTTVWNMSDRSDERRVQVAGGRYAPRYFQVPELPAGDWGRVTITLVPNDDSDVHLAAFTGSHGDRLLGVANNHKSGEAEQLSFGIEERQINALWIGVMGAEFTHFRDFSLRIEFR